MNEKVYMHTIYNYRRYNTRKTLTILEKILKSNAVLSRKNQGLEGSMNFCGEDYISLSDYEKREQYKEDFYNSYYQFVRFYTSIIFPKNKIDVVEPCILEDKIADYSDSISYMMKLGESKDERYTDLDDEVQAKDRISLDNMSGIMIPSYEIMNFWKNDSKNIDIIKKELEAYRELLQRYNKETSIYDSITTNCLDTCDGIKDTVTSLRLFNKRG